MVNRSAETLQNLCLELATMGDLKLVERPQNYTLAPGDVLYTGTCSGVGPIRPGNVLVASASRIGTMRVAVSAAS